MHAQALALEQLHHQVGRAVLAHPGVEDLDDVGVADGVRRARLVEQPAEHLLVGHVLTVEHLHRHPTTDARVLGQVHGAHSPLPQERQDAVVPELLADHLRTPMVADRQFCEMSKIAA